METANALKSSPEFDSGVHEVKPSRKRRPSSKPNPVAKKAPKIHVAGGRQKAPNGVVDEVIIATAARNRLATTLGFILGGFVPLGTFTVAHNEIPVFDSVYWAPIAMVLGGLIYSAITVHQWGVKAFESRVKAFGFVLLIEGIMTMSNTRWLSIAALVLLISINGISTGTKLALKRTL